MNTKNILAYYSMANQVLTNKYLSENPLLFLITIELCIKDSFALFFTAVSIFKSKFGFLPYFL